MTDEADVTRLHDMVVEEVSLVDRAANKHRFLIVKRDDEMAKARAKAPKDDEEVEEQGDETPPSKKPKRPFPPKAKAAPKKPASLDEEEEEETDEEDASDDDAPRPRRRGARKLAPDPMSALGIALATLEKLASSVEALEGAEGDDASFATLADELREAGDAIAKAAGGEDEEDVGEEEQTGDASGGLVTAVREMLGRLEDLTASIAGAGSEKTVAPPAAEPPPAAAAAQASPELGKTLAQIATSVKAIDASVKAQAARLTGLEKRTGLPNSRPTEETPRVRERERVSWPMDMNKPLDRENVDKSTSFHD